MFSFPIQKYKYNLTKQAETIAFNKKFSFDQIGHAFQNPNRVHASKSHEGQHHVTGYGLCLVGSPNPETSVFTIVTIYEDEPPKNTLKRVREEQVIETVKKKVLLYEKQNLRDSSGNKFVTASSNLHEKTFSFPIQTYKYNLTKHAENMAKNKGFTFDQISKTFNNPKRVYASGSHVGQHRVTGHGLCLVGIPDQNTCIFTIITIYEDEKLTPPRPDQMTTPEGQRYAERFALNLGRG